ncbi:MAG TPA: hypothetical protein VLZ28_02795 [Daejeonella sp.]|nr:hypothetical protein [Daejeonella sp.]
MMKYLLSLFIVVSFLSACKKDGVQSDFEKSREAWQDFKKKSNNNYNYTVATYSWTGFTAKTIIRVSNGVVIGREYTAYTMDGKTGQQTMYESWIEDAATLNSHTGAAQAITLDAIYEKAATVWLKVDPKQNTISFEAKNNGMISACGYIQNGCMDDCFIGIHITEIVSQAMVFY